MVASMPLFLIVELINSAIATGGWRCSADTPL
jgi:hypothetical protein